MLLAALLVSAHTRKIGELVLHEGDQGDLFGRTVTLRSIQALLPADHLQVGDESSFKLSGVSAVLATKGTDATIGTSWPILVAGRYCRIVHLGYYIQPVAVATAAGSFSGPLDLDLLPPGKSQIIAPGSSGLLFTFSLQPEKTISKGLLTGKQYNLESLRYRIVLQSNGSTSLGRSSLFITLRYTVDPALPFINAGLLLLPGGAVLMVSRLFWYRKERVAVIDGNSLFIGFSEGFYRTWGILQFHRWKEDLLQE